MYVNFIAGNLFHGLCGLASQCLLGCRKICFVMNKYLQAFKRRSLKRLKVNAETIFTGCIGELLSTEKHLAF